MYHFTDDVNTDQHFWFDKKLIENMSWARLSKASKSIYPVILSFRNEKGISFPGEETISRLSGRTEKTVRDGIRGLKGFPGFSTEQYATKYGHKGKRFHTKAPPKEPGRSFPFHKQIITGGNWLKLSPAAAALYPVMRYFGFFDEADDDVDNFAEDFANRSYDFCVATNPFLVRYSGVSPRSIFSARECLKKHFLIEKSDRGNDYEWKVFLRPPSYYKRDFLNETNHK